MIDISGLTGTSAFRIDMSQWRATDVNRIELFLRNITPPAGSSGGVFLQTFTDGTYTTGEDSLFDIFPTSTVALQSNVNFTANQEANAHCSLYKIERNGQIQVAVDRYV